MAGIALALLLAGCGAASPPASARPPTNGATSAAPASVQPLSPPVHLKVGVNQTLSESGLYIGLEKGYFRDEGLEVELTTLPSIQDMVPVLATGALDIGSGGLVPAVFNAINRGAGLRVVTIATFYAAGYDPALVARKDLVDGGQLKNYSDLKGKSYATTTANVSVFNMAYERALELGGVSREDAKNVNLSFPDMVTALANKGIDLAFLPEPFATAAVDKAAGVRWRQVGEILPDQPASMWVYSQKLVESQPEAGRRYMAALLRGARDYEEAFKKNKGRPEAVAALAKYTSIKDPALYDKIAPVKLALSGEVPLDKLKSTLEWFKERGALERVPDVNTVAESQFSAYAVSRLGPYR